MLPLHELQERFLAALFDGASEAVLPCIHAGELSAAQRVAVYRNNLHEGFTKTLALEFPVIERLIGSDYFRQLALQFLAEHPSHAGDLHHIGTPFPQFLSKLFADSEYAYLPDVAALEWACQETLVCADAAPFDVNALRAISPETYSELRFTLHPACRLVCSSYPIVRIWSTNQPDAEAEVVDLSSGADRVLVRRGVDGVELHRLPAGEFALLQSLQQRAPLGYALELALAADESFDLGAALRRFVTLGFLTDIHLPPSPSAGGITP